MLQSAFTVSKLLISSVYAVSRVHRVNLFDAKLERFNRGRKGAADLCRLSCAKIAQRLQRLQILQRHAKIAQGFPFQSGVFDVKQAQIDEKGHGKEVATVVLLGWLGSKQKHLKKYADWYNARGINAVTFVLPMSDLLCVKVGKTEEQIDQLAHHLATWLKEEGDGKEKHLFFHTFSNTGWLTYGVVLERLLRKDEKLLNRITGCVLDSAPVADPDPQVWASGFSAAFLGKRSIATQQFEAINKTKGEKMQVQPHIAEAALLTMLEKFFSFFLQIPAIKKRLTEVVGVLSNQQPSCPQLYIYTNADRVIPAKSVESFIDEQKKAGRLVKSCNLETSPHVDHFRTFPDIYGSHLNNFIKDCMPQA